MKSSPFQMKLELIFGFGAYLRIYYMPKKKKSGLYVFICNGCDYIS